MTSETPRRRLQFGLRTLFVVVALLAIPLGELAWVAHLARHRQAMRRQIEASGGIVVGKDVPSNQSLEIVPIRAPDYGYRIGAFRQQLGDELVGLIRFSRQLTDADREAIAAFPEAEIDAIPSAADTPIR